MLCFHLCFLCLYFSYVHVCSTCLFHRGPHRTKLKVDAASSATHLFFGLPHWKMRPSHENHQCKLCFHLLFWISLPPDSHPIHRVPLRRSRIPGWKNPSNCLSFQPTEIGNDYGNLLDLFGFSSLEVNYGKLLCHRFLELFGAVWICVWVGLANVIFFFACRFDNSKVQTLQEVLAQAGLQQSGHLEKNVQSLQRFAAKVPQGWRFLFTNGVATFNSPWFRTNSKQSKLWQVYINIYKYKPIGSNKTKHHLPCGFCELIPCEKQTWIWKINHL